MSETHHLPLEGVRIVSFAQLLLGPSGVQILADLGADVVKVERPETGAWERNWSGCGTYLNGESVFFLLANRNQRGFTANLKSEDGREAVLKLLDTADVLVENYRPGVMDRLGLGYEVLKKRSPRLIYVSCSGYGSTGPYRDAPGQDLLAQAVSGLASITGNADDPPVPAGTALVDQHAALLLALGVLAALLARAKTRKGQQVGVNLLNAALDLQIEPLTYFLSGANAGWRSRSGLATPFHEPPYGIYETSDGYIALSLTPGRKLAEALEAPELLRWKDSERFAHRDEVNEIIKNRLRQRSTDEWLRQLKEHGIWCSHVNTYETLFDDPQVQHNQVVQEFKYPGAGTVRVLRHPVRYTDFEPGIRRRPPQLGEHTDEILAELEYSQEEIERLHKIGAV
ncbi:CoA transferase [Acidobacteria bacterium AH-259-A15]|nr:CoA transferase [Acidobacteria bacterium AH-259-A15]